MNRFDELLASTAARPATVLHLGAGSCKEYGLYKAINAKRIIFVEPNQQLAARANEKFKTVDSVAIVAQGIATEEGRHLLNIVSNPRFSSLLAPAELLDFYPNVTVTEKIEIDTVTLAQLCVSVNISADEDSLLVVELQGLEKEILPSTAKDTLYRFRWIIISSSEHKLYESDSGNTHNHLQQLMRDAGYTVFVLKEDTTPHTNILCIRNDAVIENALLKEQEAQLLKSIAVLEKRVSTHKDDLGKQANAHQKLLDGIEKSLHLKSEECAKALIQVQSTKAENEKMARTLTAREDKITKQRAKITELNAEATNQQTAIAELNAEATKKTNKLEEMQQTLRINNKLMLKSNADLSDLQTQYRTAMQHQEQQHGLLCALKEKLREASEFYQKLNLQNLVLDGDMSDHVDSEVIDSPGDNKTKD